MRVLANFLAFQIGWFANILGAANGSPWLGPLYVVVWLSLHLMLLEKRERSPDLQLILWAAFVGYAADSLLVLLGLMTFPPQAQLGAPSPVWMVCLWMGFAATLRHSMGWVRGRKKWASVLGLIGGPLAYFAGSKLGAVILPTSLSLIGVAAVWGLVLPALTWVVEALERRITPCGVLRAERSS